MGLFSKRQKRQSRRALRRAHTKALKAQAAAERKFAAKNAKKAARAARKKSRGAVESGRKQAATAAAGLSTAASGLGSAASSAGSAASSAASSAVQAPAAALDARAQKKAAKQEKKAAQEAAKAAAKKQFTAAKARRYIGIARVVIPVLSPVLYQAATKTRGTLDARRARAIGVDVENLTEFTGHGAGLSARIMGLESSIAELDRGPVAVGAAGTEAAAAASHDRAFATSSLERLTELSTAVHAAERMPSARRRKAHSAIGSELDRIDGELLRRLGVR